MVMRTILAEQILKAKPEQEVVLNLTKVAHDYCSDLRKRLSSKGIRAQVFIGGSVAKNTVVMRDFYDIDIFVRFDAIYREKDLSTLLQRVIGSKAKKIHGSRDYFSTQVNGFSVEVVPVLKIKKPENAQNTTDLSYFRGKDILQKEKENKKLADEIILAKLFSKASNVYGAEGYIRGFSGYALELLVSHYGSFLSFIKAISGNKERIIIDDAGFYKNKDQILQNMNASKTKGPILLVDPTYKERNAAASVSQQTLIQFKKICTAFLKNPHKRFFEKPDIDIAFKRYERVLKLIVVSEKQAGDIAGSTMYKFYQYILGMLEVEFDIARHAFSYNEVDNQAVLYFVPHIKKQTYIKGPPLKFLKAVAAFRKVHSDTIVRTGFVWKKKHYHHDVDSYVKKVLHKDKDVLKRLGIIEITGFE